MNLVLEAFECCNAVHRSLGPDLLRTTYTKALGRELVRRRIPFQTAVKVPLFHRGFRLDARHLIELLMVGGVMVDVLTADRIHQAHTEALRARLQLTGVPLGLITNYRSARLVLSTVVVRHAGAFCLSDWMAKTERRDREGRAVG